MGAHINVIMQTCFFAISGVLPREQAIEEIKKAIKKTYGRKGEEVVKKNYKAVDETLANLFEVKVPAKVDLRKFHRPPTVSRPTRPSSSRTSPRASSAAKATSCPFRRCPSTGRSRPARRSTRSATSPTRYPSGTQTSASSAASAPSSARTRRSASRSTTRRSSRTRPRPSRAPTPRARNSPA